MYDFLISDLCKKNFRISDFFVTGSRIFMASFPAPAPILRGSHTLSIIHVATEKVKFESEIVNLYSPFPQDAVQGDGLYSKVFTQKQA